MINYGACLFVLFWQFQQWKSTQLQTIWPPQSHPNHCALQGTQFLLLWKLIKQNSSFFGFFIHCEVLNIFQCRISFSSFGLWCLNSFLLANHKCCQYPKFYSGKLSPHVLKYHRTITKRKDISQDIFPAFHLKTPMICVYVENLPPSKTSRTGSSSFVKVKRSIIRTDGPPCTKIAHQDSTVRHCRLFVNTPWTLWVKQ